MSAPWVEMQSGMLAWFHSITQLRAVSENEPRPQTQIGTILTLEVVRTEALGMMDERLYDYDAENNVLDEYIVGNRKITFRIKVESQNQKPDKRALRYLDDVRTALSFTSSHNAFKALGLAQWGAPEPTVHADIVVEDRLLSRTYFDVNFGYRVCEKDPTFNQNYGFIEHAQVTSEMNHPSGVLLSAPLQLDNELMPPEES